MPSAVVHLQVEALQHFLRHTKCSATRPLHTVACEIVHSIDVTIAGERNSDTEENYRSCYTRAHSVRVPITTAWLPSQVRSWGICGEQSGTGRGFLQVQWFTLPTLIPR
jgi:hypothetical protein